MSLTIKLKNALIKEITDATINGKIKWENKMGLNFFVVEGFKNFKVGIDRIYKSNLEYDAFNLIFVDKEDNFDFLKVRPDDDNWNNLTQLYNLLTKNEQRA